MGWLRLWIFVGLFLVPACSGGGSFWITIIFPSDDNPKEQTSQIKIFAIEPGTGASCQALIDGSEQPGSQAYVIEDQLTVSYPAGEGSRPLQQIGPGLRLFFAQALDQNSNIILRGCTSATAGGQGPQEVSISLHWICRPTNGGVETCDNLDNDCDGSTDDGDPAGLCPTVSQATATSCTNGLCDYTCLAGWSDANNDWSDGCECHPTRQGQEWCDGLDNDCDGLIDGAGCISCQTDEDCVDLNSCLEGTCLAGICSTETSPDNSVCDDGLFCTENDRCAQGLCLGSLRDCSAEDDDCNQGICDEVSGACVKDPLPNGSECNDGLYCTISEACADGECSGQERDCSAEDAECLIGVCVEAQGICEGQTKINGAACQDGLYCTIDDSCQAGVCTSGGPRDCSAGGGACVDGTCNEVSGQCEGDPLPEGTGCDDGLYCTVDDSCDGDGTCIANSRDCSGMSDQCNNGLCIENDAACVAQPNNEGQDCEDGDPCSQGETCQQGLCSGGQTIDCSEYSDECHDGVCDTGSCVSIPLGAGTACNDGFDCTINDACDPFAVCLGVPDDDLCEIGSFCLLECATGVDGCVAPPAIAVDCGGVVADNFATCTITTSPETLNQAACLRCTAHLIEPELARADFEDDGQPGVCSLDGWQFEENNCDNSPFGGCTLNSDWLNCCTNMICPVVSGNLAGLLALEFNELFCGNQQWRLFREFDLRAFDRAEVCYKFTQDNCDSTDVFQLDSNEGDTLDCLEGPQVPQLDMVRHCQDLPPNAFFSQAAQLIFWAKSDGPGHAWILDDISLRAGYQNCSATTQLVFEEDFEDCPGELQDGWHDWIVNGEFIECTNNGECFNNRGLRARDNDQWTMQHAVDTSALADEVNLCWLMGDRAGTEVDITVYFDSNQGDGWQTAYSDSGYALYGQGCQKICVNLAEIDPAAAANPNLQIMFDVHVINNDFYLDDITVGGVARCQADSEVATSDVIHVAGDLYNVRVDNLANRNYHVYLECSWMGAALPIGTAGDAFIFAVE